MTASGLAREIGREPPPGISTLGDEDQARLAALLAQARATQAKALDDAIDGGLSNIPRALRGVVKRTLFR